jgi:DNA-binding response OmpR family regulator
MVDDDPMVGIAIEFCLQRHGFDVFVACGSEADLHAIQTSTFDVMLVNILMPHASGFEAVRAFYQRVPTIPLIAMFGCAFATFQSPSPEFLRMTLELGARCCLRKPFTRHALLAAVNLCLTRPAITPQPLR